MKTITYKLLVVPVLLTLLAAGCSLDDPDHPTSFKAPQGAQYFETYVSVGNSLTAGFMDGGLMMPGQGGSYPSLIAGQIGSSDFTQPWVASPGIGGINEAGSVDGVLYFTGAGLAVLGTTPLATVSDLAIAKGQPAPYHNLAVPGATLNDMFNTIESAANPFFTLINRVALYGNSTVPATVMDTDFASPVGVTYETASLGWQAIAKSPTLATFWAGNNDALGWATRGGDQSPVPITPRGDFQSQYFTALQLLAGGLIETTGYPAAIFVANIPYVSSTPYFLPEALFSAMLPGALGGSWPAGYEEADVELVRFPTLSWITTANPMTDPIPASYTLTATEVATVNTAIDEFNVDIATYAGAVTASGAATVVMVDMNSLMVDIAAGTSEWGPYAGQHFIALALNPATAPHAMETLFSLDGIHPNNRGYGVVANAFIEKINETLGTTVATVNVDALVWDPTYADYQPGPEPAKSTALVSPAAARAMDAVFH